MLQYTNLLLPYNNYKPLICNPLSTRSLNRHLEDCHVHRCWQCNYDDKNIHITLFTWIFYIIYGGREEQKKGGGGVFKQHFKQKISLTSCKQTTGIIKLLLFGIKCIWLQSDYNYISTLVHVFCLVCAWEIFECRKTFDLFCMFGTTWFHDYTYMHIYN